MSGWHKAFDNIMCFTPPELIEKRVLELLKEIEPVFDGAKAKISVVRFLMWLGVALDGSCELRWNLKDEKRYPKRTVSDSTLLVLTSAVISLLKILEVKHKALINETLKKENDRMAKIMSSRGKSLFADKAKSVPVDSSEGWIKYWSDFSRNSNMRKFRDAVKGLIGVDYGLGAFEARILWGADLVMMNPTLARLALAEDEELSCMAKDFASCNKDKLCREDIVRNATKIAGLKARYSLRAVFLLTGRGKVSFQVNPRTYNRPDKLENDLRTLFAEFNKEAVEYDADLFLEDVLLDDEIKERKSRTHVFFKVDGSNKDVYGNIEKVMLDQVKSGKFELASGDTGVMEKVIEDGINTNVTVAGFLTDGLYSFFCQIRGHAKARKKGIPISHSIITKMGGRVEAAIRWIAVQKLLIKVKGNGGKEEEVKKIDHTKNGTLDDAGTRKTAKEAGFVLAEEIMPKDYAKHKGNIFPSEAALCSIAEAVSKRSHEIMEALKKHPVLKAQKVEDWETGDLQASMRPAYAGRFPHVEDLAGMYSQGHFPDIILSIENWSNFTPHENNITKPVDPMIISQLYNSIIGDDFARVYETDDTLKEVLKHLRIYKEEYGTKGIKISELSEHPFSKQTLFNKVIEVIPETEEDKDAVKTGFIGDFNLLYEELVKQP
jgi:predicted transcriptional regulator